MGDEKRPADQQADEHRGADGEADQVADADQRQRQAGRDLGRARPDAEALGGGAAITSRIAASRE